MKIQSITEGVAKAILAKSYIDAHTGRRMISLGNCALDFSKRYFFNGFTDKTVKLSYQNGDKEIVIQGRVEDRGDYYALYAEGWRYIEHIEKSEIEVAQ